MGTKAWFSEKVVEYLSGDSHGGSPALFVTAGRRVARELEQSGRIGRAKVGRSRAYSGRLEPTRWSSRVASLSAFSVPTDDWLVLTTQSSQVPDGEERIGPGRVNSRAKADPGPGLVLHSKADRALMCRVDVTPNRMHPRTPEGEERDIDSAQRKSGG